MALKTTAKGFKKGDTVFYFCNWDRAEIRNGFHQQARIQKCEVQSAGKRVHMTREVSGQFVKFELYDDEWLFATEAEAEAFARETLPQMAAQSIAGSLRCEESCLEVVNAKYRPQVESNIAALKAAVPTFTVYAEEVAEDSRIIAKF
jgi:hypothetical protein